MLVSNTAHVSKSFNICIVRWLCCGCVMMVGLCWVGLLVKELINSAKEVGCGLRINKFRKRET